MNKTRLLLPFTHSVRADALEYAVLMAQSRNAILVSLSILQTSSGNRAKGPRLEHVQQSKDFLETVACKALKHGVEVEKQEIITADPIACIQECREAMNCDGILLLVENGKGVLLQTTEVKHVIASGMGQVHIIRIQSEQSNTFYKGFLSRLAYIFSRGEAQQVPSKVLVP